MKVDEIGGSVHSRDAEVVLVDSWIALGSKVSIIALFRVTTVETYLFGSK